MLARCAPLTLALALAIASTSTLAAPAWAQKCREITPKKYFKAAGKNNGCSKEGLEDITAMTTEAQLHFGGVIGFAKHAAGGYYLAYRFSCPACKGHFQVRAADDPLVFILKHDKTMEFRALRDGSSIKRGIYRNYCGFYPITKQQLWTLSNTGIEAVKVFIVADDEFKDKKLNRTEDGRSYLFIPTKESIRKLASCAWQME